MKTTFVLLVPVVLPLLVGCAGSVPPPPKNSSPELGAVENTAGEQSKAQLIHCNAPLGTAALVEPEPASLEQVGLPSPIPLFAPDDGKERLF